MRGDSLRDLYAKTLALLGLGVLAGAGALVDFWPIGFDLPHIPPVLARPQVAVAIAPSADLARFTAAVPEFRFVRVRHTTTTEPIVTAPDVATIPPVPPSDAPLGRPVTLPQPYAILVAATADSSTRPAAVEVSLVPVDIFEPEAPQVARYEPAVLADDNDGGGFVTTAFKKTGTSIVRTGVRTGASIFDAVRVVGSVVRRALPN